MFIWLKNFIKKLLPRELLNWTRPYYHGITGLAASIYYGGPSRHLIVVGITGTAGKSTTTHMLAHILNKAGIKTGFITTIDFFDGNQTFLNQHGLSMPNEIRLQRELKAMLENGCKAAVVESTSEGLAQNRHWGINYDVALITNLSPAHIEAHGGFENYRASKAKLFQALQSGKRKSVMPKKIIGLNADDAGWKYFLKFQAEERFGISFGNQAVAGLDKVYTGRVIEAAESNSFEIQGKICKLNLPGKFNIQNALMAVATANMLGVNVEEAVKALSGFNAVAGRMEEISNSLGLKIFVDYAPEPAGMKNALESLAGIPHKRIIHVFGSTGGHRDKQKRFEFGKISSSYADEIIITNDDVYDSDPREIAENIRSSVKRLSAGEAGEEGSGKVCKIILDRRQAIAESLKDAKPGDVVIITGKGSEQFLVLPGNRRIHWDDRQVVREELAKLVL